MVFDKPFISAEAGESVINGVILFFCYFVHQGIPSLTVDPARSHSVGKSRYIFKTRKVFSFFVMLA